MTEQMTRIYEEYHPKILHYIESKISNHAEAEDIAADVFVKVCQKYDTYDSSKAALSTWIYTIARNAMTDHFRTAKVFEEIPETLANNDAVEEEFLQEESLSELADALEKLPQRERDLIVLHYYSGLSLKEVALRLGMSYSNTKLVHNKALVMLQGKLKQFQ